MAGKHSLRGAKQFYKHFAGYMSDAGYSSEQMLRYLWKPHQIDDLKITGPGRDLNFEKLETTTADVENTLADSFASDRFVDHSFYSTNKTIVVLVPGFTHETLKNLSLHEEVLREDSPHEVLMLTPGEPGSATREEVFSHGAGFKLVYAKYPRSNAASEHIAKPLFELLHNSETLRHWVNNEGYRLFFLGYSYGCPLSLELFANMNSGRFQDDFILKNTTGFLAMCGAIGGSYLADDAMSSKASLVSVPALVDTCNKRHWLSKLLGMPTQAFRDDMLGGVRSLTRPVRQARMAEYAQYLPAHLRYFSISAVLPLADYKRKWWQFNLDDYLLHKQALISDPISVYNDGQVVSDDNLIPRPSHIPSENIIHLGAVRAHHWAVSYKTFNFGKSDFPRRPFYKALMQTIFDLTQG